MPPKELKILDEGEPWIPFNSFDKSWHSTVTTQGHEGACPNEEGLVRLGS